MIPFLTLAGLVVLAVVVMLGVWLKLRKRGLSASQAEKLIMQWQSAVQVADLGRRVLETEKILDGALTLLGYPGSFGDKLKRAGPRFKHVQSIWDAHKLRNRIAHETGFTVNGSDAKRAADAFARGLRDLGVNVLS